MALNDVKTATKSIWVTMCSLTDPDYLKALIDKRKEFPDMDIKVIIDLKWIRENKSGLNAVCDLIASGIDVFHLKKRSKLNHQELFICDGRFAATGTFNWTKAGTHTTDEDLTYMIGFEPVEEAKKTFLIQLINTSSAACCRDQQCRLCSLS